MNMENKRVLILCTGNSCRSQIAEGYLRFFAVERAEVFSAGVETHGLNPRAVETMAEDGIDISHQTSNLVDEYRDLSFDILITVCDHAKEVCPYLPGIQKVIHHSFPDPAQVSGSEEEIRKAFREVRDQIRTFCRHVAEEEL